MGYSPLSRKELDMTEVTTEHNTAQERKASSLLDDGHLGLCAQLKNLSSLSCSLNPESQRAELMSDPGF